MHNATVKWLSFTTKARPVIFNCTILPSESDSQNRQNIRTKWLKRILGQVRLRLNENKRDKGEKRNCVH